MGAGLCSRSGTQLSFGRCACCFKSGSSLFSWLTSAGRVCIPTLVHSEVDAPVVVYLFCFYVAYYYYNYYDYYYYYYFG